MCPIHGNRPKSNQEFWDKKLLRNQQRDREVTEYYLEKGWHIKRILEHEIKKDINQVVDNLVDFINKVRLSETSNSSIDTKDMLQYNSAKYDELSMLAAVESNEKRLDASEFINPLILGLSDEVPGQSFSVFN